MSATAVDCSPAPAAYSGTDDVVAELRAFRGEQAAWCLHHDERLTALQVHQEEAAESIRAAGWFVAGLIASAIAVAVLKREFA